MTLRVIGSIKGHEVVILVDGGSTHNFVHDRLAYFLYLATQLIPRLAILVGNDTEIACDKVCHDVAVLIKGHNFNLDLYVMALGGTDLVQGVAWLKLLGPFTTNYSLLTMSFVYHRQPITIQDEINPDPSEITHG